MVNLGAAFLPSGATRASSRSNIDESWTLFFGHKELKLRMVAFEGDARAHAVNLQRLAREDNRTQSRITSVNEYVNSSTIFERLVHGFRVPLKPLLLKIDIDSIELPIANALLAGGMRPSIIFAEFNYKLPRNLKFAALEPSASQLTGPRAPTYGRGVHWTLGACNGASLGMWYSFARQNGYALIRADSRNVLLVQSSDASLFNTSNALRCHKSTGFGGGWIDSEKGLRQALYNVDGMCTSQVTPYTVRAFEDDEDSCACPLVNRGKRQSLFCRCEIPPQIRVDPR